MTLEQYISSQTTYSTKGIRSSIALLKEGATIPFIARYRKEWTGNMDENALENIAKKMNDFEALSSRKESIKKAITEQGFMTPELEHKIQKSNSIAFLEDLYLPFKKKRKTKADTAIENGLIELAKKLLKKESCPPEKLASSFLSDKVPTVEKALEGARYIVAQQINEIPIVRNDVRKRIQRFAILVAKKKRGFDDSEQIDKYKNYLDWEGELTKISSHQLLAILRAEKKGILSTKLELDHKKAQHAIIQYLHQNFQPYHGQIVQCVEDAYKRLIFPALANEALNEAKEKADEEAIAVFAKNLNQLLLKAPLGEKRILAIDPGFKSGCKIVCLDKHGNLLVDDIIYPHPPKNDIQSAKITLKNLVKKYAIEAISIGNGTASRETEKLVRSIQFEQRILIFVVSEAGASIYSASKIARTEFPDKDVTVRGAISIGRRLQDPLAELVKIDPKAIGVGQYQHDVDQVKLKESLDRVVTRCVNAIGVNVNTASPSLLQYVSGLGPTLAQKYC